MVSVASACNNTDITYTPYGVLNGFANNMISRTVISQVRLHRSCINVNQYAETVQGFCRALRPSRSIPSTLSRPLLMRFTPSPLRPLSTETRAAIDQAVASRPVVLFMKGTPETPQCGFSKASIQILGLQGVDPNKFSAFNVLEDEKLRQGTTSSLLSDRSSTCSRFGLGLKQYSDWPTIPQLYVDKEFVGGCDILMSMHQNGELSKMLEEKGVLVPAEAPLDVP